MRPSDPRLRAQLAPARRELIGVAGAGVLTGLLVIAQAWAVAGLVLAALPGQAAPWWGGSVLAWGTAVAAVLLARAAVGGLGDRLAARAASTVSTVLRHRLVVAATTTAGR